MDITDSLRLNLKEHSVISFVGAGGKTSTMFRLARELKDKNKRVLVTTTTAIYYPAKDQYDYLFMPHYMEEVLDRFKNIEKGTISVLGGGIKEGIKLKGIPCKNIDFISSMKVFDFILVEADGSKGKSIKAPEYYEPVIPDSTDVLVGIIGFDCYGKNLNCQWVHRPEKLIAISGSGINDIINKEVIIRLVLSRDGLFKDSSKECYKIVLLNKVENDEDKRTAEEIGALIVNRQEGIDKVLVGSVTNKDPIKAILE